MKFSFTKKPDNFILPSTLTQRLYNPFRDRIRKHISDINDVITDEDLRSVNVMQIVKQTGGKGDLSMG